jgi:hypothetical protein
MRSEMTRVDREAAEWVARRYPCIPADRARRKQELAELELHQAVEADSGLSNLLNSARSGICAGSALAIAGALSGGVGALFALSLVITPLVCLLDAMACQRVEADRIRLERMRLHLWHLQRTARGAHRNERADQARHLDEHNVVWISEYLARRVVDTSARPLD